MSHVCQLSTWRFMLAAHVSLYLLKVYLVVMKKLRISDSI
jgi:hypothetical protein